MNTTPHRVICKRSWRVPGDGGRSIAATVGLVHYAGNPRPTFEVLAAEGAGERFVRYVMADEVAKLGPELAAVAPLHLADDTGEPVHVVDSACCFAGVERPAWADVNALAWCLRISAADAGVIVGGVAAGKAGRAALVSFVDGQRARWLAEAQAARAILEGGVK